MTATAAFALLGRDPDADGYETSLERFRRIGRPGYVIGLLGHAGLLVAFAAIGEWLLVGYSVLSCLVFALALRLHEAGRWQIAFVMAALEVAAHAILTTAILGLAGGFHYHVLTLVFVSIYVPLARPSHRYALAMLMAVDFVGIVAFGQLYGAMRPLDEPLAIAFHIGNVLTFMAALGVMVVTHVDAVAGAEKALTGAYRKSETLLRNILPAAIADRLKERPGTVAERFGETTVLFADIVNFTPMAERMAPEALVGMLDQVSTAFDEIADRLGVEKIKTIGDAYMAVAGVPSPRPDHALVIAELAREMRIASRNFRNDEGEPLALRIGIESGSVVAGVIGRRKFAYDLWGDTVNTAARMESAGVPDEIQLGPKAEMHLRGHFRLAARGPIQVKGKAAMNTWLLGEPIPGGRGAPAEALGRTLAGEAGEASRN